MLSYKTAALALIFSFAIPVVPLPIRREVPQEHSHNQFLATVRQSLASNNPLGIVDPVFGLLGDAAAAGGLGKFTDPDCLQQATADQAFTNAKKAGDVQGQVAALIYRTLERNTGKVGLASVKCTSTKAVNPEIAALSQHQDPASPGAAAINKAIVLGLAKQIKSVGGNPQDALKSGTFAPGLLTDNTGKGNTCDDANDPVGCIITKNLLVPDATAAEINAAVGGAAPAAPSSPAVTVTAGPSASTAVLANAGNANCPPPVTVTISPSPSATPNAAPALAADPSTASSAPASSPASSASGSAGTTAGNLQTFTGSLGGAAPAVTPGGRGFQVAGSDDFVNESGALGRSCDIQHNNCANVANSIKAAGFSVSDCDTQNTACHATIPA
jgi:hypothetical protein